MLEAQKANPAVGDFVKLVKEDLDKLGIKHNDLSDIETTKKELRTIVKDVAFSKLSESSRRSTKMEHIRYSKLETQPYLSSKSLCQDERNILTSLRSRCVRGIKQNFKNMHRQCLHCPLMCNSEHPFEDTQEHVLLCSKLKGSYMDHDYVYSESMEQIEVTKQYTKLMEERTKLLEEGDSPSTCCLPGASILDPSTINGAPVAV